jgi:hypothetical protein
MAKDSVNIEKQTKEITIFNTRNARRNLISTTENNTPRMTQKQPKLRKV